MSVNQEYLQTDLAVSSSFEVWTGYPLLTLLDLVSDFTYDTEKTLITTVPVISTFTAGNNPTRTLIDSCSVESDFNGSVLSESAVNTDIEAIDPEPNPIMAGDNKPTIYFTINGLVLYAPDFGDSAGFKQIRNVKYSRGNSLIIFREISWGTEKIYEYSFSYLTKDQRHDLLQLIRSTLGRRVTILDHLGVTRIGFIISPEAEIFEPVPHGFTATLKFQEG